MQFIEIIKKWKSATSYWYHNSIKIMFDTVKEIEDKYGITFATEHYSGYTDFILNVFNNTNEESLDSISPDAIKLNICGIYHDTVTKNYAEMEKYYLMAIELGHVNAMSNLGLYHKQVTKNYAEMENYYLMAIALGNASAMTNLGYYHQFVTQNYAEMEKYFLMAIELGHANAINNLGTHYKNNSIKLFASLNTHFDSKQDHMDAFLKEYCKLLKEEAVQSHIQDKIMGELCGGGTTNSLVNKHLYEKYIQTEEKTTGLYASDFTIVVTLGANDTEDVAFTKTYHVHSHVLNSEYFLNLIDSGFMETNSINMEASDVKVMDILLKYLYVNEWPKTNTITKEQLESIRQIADEFAFDALAKLCSWAAKSNGLYM